MISVLPKISLFLSGVGLIGGTQLVPSTPEPIPLTVIQEATKGNCEIIDSLGQVIKELGLSSPYVAVSCQTMGESDFGILGDNWTGLIPTKYLKQDKWGFNKGRGLNIMTKTDYADEYREESISSGNDGSGMFNTVFNSQQFVNPEIVGNWDYGDKKYDDNSVDFVTPTKPQLKEKIYFVHVD